MIVKCGLPPNRTMKLTKFSLQLSLAINSFVGISFWKCENQLPLSTSQLTPIDTFDYCFDTHTHTTAP